MVDMALITGTISGLKTAGDIANSILKLQSISDIRAKVIELQSAILSAQSSALEANANQSALVEKIRTLEEEIAQIKAWGREKQRYKLISPWNGAFVYSLKESMSKSEPPHWICTSCYENGEKSILQERGNPKTAYREFFCKCGTIIYAHHRGKGYNIRYVKE